MSFLTIRALFFFFGFRASLVAVPALTASKTTLLLLTVGLDVAVDLTIEALNHAVFSVGLDDSSQVVDDDLVLHKRFQVTSLVNLHA